MSPLGPKCTFLVLLTSSLIACNTLTGAEDVVLYPSAKEAIMGGGASSPGGAGGAGGAGGTVTVCEWPEAPSFGVSQGMTLPDYLQWQGLPENSDESAQISIQDYYDCDGTRGINALFITTSQFGCGACTQEAQELQGKMDGGWRDMGIHVLTLLLDGPGEATPTIESCLTWKQQYGFVDIAVAPDANFSMVPGSSVGTPQGTIVDPRTMQVVDLQEGYPSNESLLTSTAQQNAQ